MVIMTAKNITTHMPVLSFSASKRIAGWDKMDFKKVHVIFFHKILFFLL
jgi:hypothetical protein